MENCKIIILETFLNLINGKQNFECQKEIFNNSYTRLENRIKKYKIYKLNITCLYIIYYGIDTLKHRLQNFPQILNDNVNKEEDKDIIIYNISQLKNLLEIKTKELITIDKNND